MENFPCCKVIRRDAKKCNLEIDLVDNVMKSPCAVYFLDRRNELEVQLITKRKTIPNTLTSIQIEVIPSNMTKFYYSLMGLETILFNLFRSENKPFQNDLKIGEVYLKTYYKQDKFYTLPVLCMDVIFLRKLHAKTIDNLWKILKNELILFTGSVGNIELININSVAEFHQNLKIPLLIGMDEFENEGFLKQKNFSEDQIDEMNHIHGIPIMKLNMNEIINNNFLSIFDEMRYCILSSKTKTDNFDDDSLAVVDSIFNQHDDDDYDEEEEDDFPF